MSPDAADLDRRIAEAEAGLTELAAGSAEARAARVTLAVSLAARYLQHHGAEEDRTRAEQICQDVLADEQATPDERQSMAMLRPALTMLAASPAQALRGRPPVADAEALRRSQEWLQEADPADVAAGMKAIGEQFDAIPDQHTLPPGMQSVMATMRAAAELMADVQRPDWDGNVDPGVLSRLTTAAAEAPAGMPGLELLTGLAGWLKPPPAPAEPEPEPGTRVAELESALAGLSADHLLTPLLQRDLAQALVAEVERSGRPDALHRATELLEQAHAGMAPDHPYYADTVRILAGATLTAAAYDPTSERFARAEQVAEELLRQPSGDGPGERGRQLFLRSMLGLLGSRMGGAQDAGAAVQDLLRAIELLPAEHPLRPVAVGQLAAVLADRHLLEGMLENAEAANYILDRALPAVADELDDGSRGFLECVAAMSRINHAVRVDDAAALSTAAAAMRNGLAALPDGHLMRPNFELVLGIAGLKGAVLGHDQDQLLTRIEAVRQVAGAGPLAGIAQGVVTELVGTLDVMRGLLTGDTSEVALSLDRMEAGLAAPVAFTEHRVGQLALLGKNYVAAIGNGAASAADADKAIALLEQARELVVEQRAGVVLADILKDLASAYRIRGDRTQARRCAFQALEVHAGTVLLQSGVAHAIQTARGAAADAAALARWCLADGDPTGAAAAVELGRGLALHAATSALGVPTLLHGIGRPELAADWRREVAARRERPAPWTDPAGEPPADPAGTPPLDLTRAASDLRHQVIDVLRGTAAGARLFSAPSTADVQRALGEVGADALAYLLPGDEHQPGQILLIGRSAEPVAVPAPLLRVAADDPLTRYLQTPQHRDNRLRWRAALERLCDWAGGAVLEPLLGALGRVRPGGPDDPWRVVLVPGGLLGAVPWPAARRDGPAGPRHACTDLVLSSAASARQLIDVASRIAQPPQLEPVLVSAPTADLSYAVEEVLALREVFYPEAIVYGDLSGMELAATDGAESGPELLHSAGPGTPDEILARLPGARTLGASLLHLGCHAVTASTPEASHLELSTPLSIKAVLDHAAGRDVDAPGPLVVLAACRSDLTERDYDEALTLATAFLAAGAVTVVGARWDVSDRLTAILMFAFHHFLIARAQPAPDALRSAQLWMLDPQRRELPGMPDAMLGDVDTDDLTDIVAWAGFGHHGR